MKAGAVEFLLKPIQGEVVIATVCRLLELHRARTGNTVLKQAAVRSGAVRLQSLPFHMFEEGDTLRADDGSGGYERGLADGRRLMEEERRQDLAVLTDAVRKFDAARSMLQQTMEDEVIALAFQTVSKILRESAESCREQIIVQAKAALSAVRDAASVVIQVHPLDAAILEAARAELTGQRDMALTITVEAVPSLPRGSCLLHTRNRLVDASLDTQLARLGEALKNRAHRES
jgi:flagellar biosynthesis/type III secretory pathway protein FliH